MCGMFVRTKRQELVVRVEISLTGKMDFTRERTRRNLYEHPKVEYKITNSFSPS